MSEAKVIVEYNGDYADEFNVNGFAVLDSSEYTGLMLFMERYFAKGNTFEFCFGTNECIEYQNFKRFINDFESTLISDEDYAVLTKLGLTYHGKTPFDQLFDIMGED